MKDNYRIIQKKVDRFYVQYKFFLCFWKYPYDCDFEGNIFRKCFPSLEHSIRWINDDIEIKNIRRRKRRFKSIIYDANGNKLKEK